MIFSTKDRPSRGVNEEKTSHKELLKVPQKEDRKKTHKVKEGGLSMNFARPVFFLCSQRKKQREPRGIGTLAMLSFAHAQENGPSCQLTSVPFS